VSNGQLSLVITTAVEHMSVERQKESDKAGGLFLVPFGSPFDQAAFERLTQRFVEPVH
jgi:hypothetical protein